MRHRPLFLIALILLLQVDVACHRHIPQHIVNGEIPTEEYDRILSVTLVDGRKIEFDRDGGTFLEGVVSGRTSDGGREVIPQDQIAEALVEHRENNTVGTVVLTVFVTGVALAIYIVTYFAINPPRSCPFIYSWDGSRYVFDAQTYGGAITPGMTRTDVVRLEHLAPVDKHYRLMMRNDPLGEVQHTDQVRLLVVDHTPGHLVAPSYDGEMFELGPLVSPREASSSTGADLLPYFRANDQVRWKSQMPVDSAWSPESSRDHVTLIFPRPAGGDSARMLVKAGTDFWGAAMIQGFLDLLGDSIDTWYAGVDRRGEELRLVQRIMVDEELYHMRVNVLTRSGWQVRGIIRSGGAVAEEDHVIELDLHDVEGDSVVVRLDPPRGFWTLDYLGLDFSPPTHPAVHDLSPLTAIDNNGKDVQASLARLDQSYHDLPHQGDYAIVTFNVPELNRGKERSIFLAANGWYRVTTDRTEPKQSDLLQRIMTTPGAAHHYAMNRYLQWRNLHASLLGGSVR